MSAADNPLVSTEWLHEHLGDSHVKVLDATWFLPGDERDPKAMFEEARIPGAAFFDIDLISDPDDPLPHMVPQAEAFALQVEELGVSDEDTVVVYHAAEMLSAPRAWWMFRLFGHTKVFVLDGGLVKWRAEGRPVESGPPVPPAVGRFTPEFDVQLLHAMAEVHEAVKGSERQVIDARSRLGSAASCPSPGRACARAICPARSTCPPIP